MLTLWIGCAVHGLGHTAADTEPNSEGETATAADPTLDAPAFPVSSDLVVLASDSQLWVLEDDDTRVPVVGVAPGDLSGWGTRYTVTTDPIAGAFTVVEGAESVGSFTASCGSGWLEGALPWREDVLVLCGDAPSYRLASDGTRTDWPIQGVRWWADSGRPYAVNSSQEGTFAQELDATTLEPLADAWWLGYQADVEGDWFLSVDDPYAGDTHDLHLVARAGATLDLPVSSVNTATFVHEATGPRALVLVDHLDVGGGPAPRWWSLVDASGHEWDGALEVCAGPDLRSTGPSTVEGWCGEPLRRYRWTWDGVGWARAEEQAFADAVSVTIVEP